MKPLDGLTIIVDVDDVIYDLLKEWLRRYNADYGDVLTTEDIRAWDLTLFVKPECGNKIYDYLLQDDLYNEVDMFPFSKHAIDTLREWGAVIKIVTANHNVSKEQRLIADGIATADEIIVADDKSSVPADIIIDDYVKNLVNHPAIGIMVSRPHNKETDWSGLRSNDWINTLIHVLDTAEVLKYARNC